MACGTSGTSAVPSACTYGAGMRLKPVLSRLWTSTSRPPRPPKLTQAIRDRQISSRELLDDLLARAERLNPALNAIVA